MVAIRIIMPATTNKRSLCIFRESSSSLSIVSRTKMERLHVLKCFLMLIFTTAVIILSIKAVKHLTDESISTTFQYRFGDDNQGNLNLMSITICPGQFIKRQNETKYSMLQYNESLSQLDWNINETLKFFKLGGNYDFGPGEMNHLWMPVSDWKYGRCYTFDPEAHQMLKVKIIATNSISSYLVQQLTLDFERLGEFYEDDITIKIFLHEYVNDFTFAKHKVNDFFELEKGQIMKYYMKKTVVRSLPAKDRPCSRKRYYGLRSCIEDSAAKLFVQEARCALPWMQDLHPKVAKCSDNLDEHDKAWQDYKCIMTKLSEVTDKNCNTSETDIECEALQSCDEIILERTLKEEKSVKSNKSMLVLDWNQPRIIYVQDFVSYDFHNFIGEVGGFLGLFWGFSFTSVFIAFEWIRSKLINTNSEI